MYRTGQSDGGPAVRWEDTGNLFEELKTAGKEEADTWGQDDWFHVERAADSPEDERAWCN